jgi:hypothetical protein
MVNVHDCWPLDSAFPAKGLTKSVFEDMLQRRKKTFKAFAETEATKGFIKPGTPLSTSQGQEMLRLLLFRVIEELSEAQASTEEAHASEELIDALNFLWSLIFIDEQEDDLRRLAERLVWAWAKAGHTRRTFIQPHEFCNIVYAMGNFADHFRNRPWMKQTQDVYFTGRRIMLDLIAEISKFVFDYFLTERDFYNYFIAKDEVLQFRIRSNY